MTEPLVFVVQGPTASGKTLLAIELAQRFQTEIISFDSRQFYQELNIGVARPTAEELAAVQHHFVATHSIQTPLNANEFAKQAQAKFTALVKQNGAVVLVGGSALFADALLLGLDPLPHDPSIQKKWQAIYAQEGLSALQNELAQKDPAFFAQIDQMNPVRLLRALEVVELTGQSNLELRGGPKADPPHLKRFFIDWPREELYARINRRVDLMIKEGLEQEARCFYPDQQKLQALQTVGYQEFFDFFNGQISRDEAIEKIKQHSRNYAKRQLTWLKKYAQIHALNPHAKPTIIAQALQRIG